MTEPTPRDVYDRREQTLVKHEILRNYLLPFALIIGRHHPSITYVDCFSGPWNSRTSDYRDTSFGIAIEQLKAARNQIASMGKKPPRLRAYFIESDKNAFAQLDHHLDTVSGIAVRRRNAEFAECVGDICSFVAEDPRTFPFFLIDPKGWDIPLETIRPLLEHDPGEVLVMFMTEHIRRFLNHRQAGVRDTFDAMYGERDVARHFHLLSGFERDEALVAEYQRRVQTAGAYTHSSAATVLHAVKNRTHFNLIYLTRHHRGIEKFKDSERRAMKAMESARAAAEQKKDEASGQRSLFDAQEAPESIYYKSLRQHALDKMNQTIARLAMVSPAIPYDELWAQCMRGSLVWPTDLSARIVVMEKKGELNVRNRPSNERTPKVGCNHIVEFASRRIDDSDSCQPI